MPQGGGGGCSQGGPGEVGGATSALGRGWPGEEGPPSRELEPAALWSESWGRGTERQRPSGVLSASAVTTAPSPRRPARSLAPRGSGLGESRREDGRTDGRTDARADAEPSGGRARVPRTLGWGGWRGGCPATPGSPARPRFGCSSLCRLLQVVRPGRHRVTRRIWQKLSLCLESGASAAPAGRADPSGGGAGGGSARRDPPVVFVVGGGRPGWGVQTVPATGPAYATPAAGALGSGPGSRASGRRTRCREPRAGPGPGPGPEWREGAGGAAVPAARPRHVATASR